MGELLISLILIVLAASLFWGLAGLDEEGQRNHFVEAAADLVRAGQGITPPALVDLYVSARGISRARFGQREWQRFQEWIEEALYRCTVGRASLTWHKTIEPFPNRIPQLRAAIEELRKEDLSYLSATPRDSGAAR